MAVIYGDLDRRIFTGASMNKYYDIFVNHNEMAQQISNDKIDSVIELSYARREGVPLTPIRGEKHQYTCIMVQGNVHILFAYESYDFTDENNINNVYSCFIHPEENNINDFKSDNIIY